MKNKLTTLLGCACLLTLSSSAATFTFDTPAGASTGHPVDAEAVFSISGTTLSITLTDLEANPIDVAQAISDLSFHISTGPGGASLGSSSGQEVTIDGNGNPTLGSTVSTGWSLTTVGSDLHLNVLGTPIGPAHLIIGPPDGTGVYSAANGSIANKNTNPHNPFLNGSATFTLDISSLTDQSVVDAATFSFGTTAGIDVVGVPNISVPDGGTTVLLLGAAISGLGLIRRKLS